MNEKTDWVYQNFNAVSQISIQLEACHRLNEHCFRIIRYDPIKVFQANDFNLIDKKVLLEILQSDMLNVNEIVLWESVLKWGIAQTNLDSDDHSKWTTSEAKELEELISDCVTHIRFFDISGSDYWDKIRPYKKLISDELSEDLERFFITRRPPLASEILPSRMYDIVESVLALPQHFARFASWIDDKPEIYSLNKIPYKFELIYRGSWDGMNNIPEFKKRCQCKSYTLIVIKVANANKLVGGFNPYGWDFDNTWTKSHKSFIYSLDNNKELTNCIFSSIKKYEYAISDARGKDIGFGHDLEFFEGGRYKHEDYDKKILDEGTFEVEDFEVFKLNQM